MIETIKHKGLRRLHEKDDHGGIRSDLIERVRKILSALEAANSAEDLALPAFRFQEGAAHDVDLEDYEQP